MSIETCPECGGSGYCVVPGGYYPLEGCPLCWGAGYVDEITEDDIPPDQRDAPELVELYDGLVACDCCPLWHYRSDRRCPDGDGDRGPE